MSTIIYSRYSTDMQRPESCEDQQRKVQEYLARNRVPTGDITVLKDEAISGTREARAAYDQIKARVTRHEAFLLAVDDQSRLSRGDNVKALIRDLVFAGGRFISTGEGIDTAQPGWELKVGIMELHNSLTIADTGRRVRRGQEGRVLDGNGSAGDFPYGYRSEYLDPRWHEAPSRGPKPKKCVRIHEEEAVWVRQIFAWFVAGRSISAITRELNRSHVDKGHRSTRPGWGAHHVRRILSNAKYIGRWAWGTTRTIRDSQGRKRKVAVRPEEAVEVARPELQIIDAQTWARTQEHLGELHKAFGRKPGQLPRGPRAHYTKIYPKGLLGGLLVCAKCGERFIAQGSLHEVYYGCSNYRKGNGCMQAIRVPRAKGLAVLAGFLRDVYRHRSEWLAEVMKALEARLDHLSRQVPAAVTLRRAERDKLLREIANLTGAVAESGSAGGTLTAAITERETRLAVVNAALQETEALAAGAVAMPSMEWIDEQVERLDQLLLDDPQGCARLLRTLIGKITVHEQPLRGKRRGYIRMEFDFDQSRAGIDLLKEAISPSILRQCETSGPLGAVRHVSLDIGGPSRMDEWAPKIAQMRAEGVSWREIGKRTGLGCGNAHQAWKRWSDALEVEERKSTA